MLEYSFIMVNKALAILHIGVEKTGTTTIQEFLYRNKGLLEQQGLFFPALITPRNHRPLAVYCSKSKRSNLFTRMKDIDAPKKRAHWKAEFRELFKMEMEKIDGLLKTAIFSSEHFSTLLKDIEEIRRLQSVLEPFFSSVYIVIYIRRQDLIAGSMISNAAKAGHGKRLPRGDQIFCKHYYNYNKLVNKWGGIFGKDNLRIRIFEQDQLIDNNLLTDFMQQVGIEPDPGFQMPKRMNASLSGFAVEAAWLFNKKCPPEHYEGNLDELRKLRLELIRQVNANLPGHRKMLHRQDAKKIVEQYKKSNQRLAKKWFSRDNLFSQDFSMYPHQEESVNPDLIWGLVEDFITQKGLNTKANE